MSSRVQKIAAAASAVVLALGVSSCGGDDEPTPAASSSSSSPASSGGGGDASQAAFFQSLADAQVDARSSHVSMTIGAGGQTITAEGDVAIGDTPADTAMSMTMDMGATGMGSLSMILVDNALYLNFGQMTGGKYGKVDLDDTSNPIAQQFGSITEQLDPSKQLDQFKDALTSMEKKGDPETIDGVEAQPYELTLDTSKLPSLAGQASGAGAALPKSLTYTMFIGPDDLLRRVTADVAGSSITADYSRWGEPVEVEAPPAGEVSEDALSQLAGS